MNYYLDLYSPETANAFSKSDMTITGFRPSRKTYVKNQNIGNGDKFICYCTRIQRFIGILEVKSKSFTDNKPVFSDKEDPFTLRFKVEAIIWLPLEKGVPIHDDSLWPFLSFTKGLTKDSSRWTYMVFGSPRLWPKSDGEYIEKRLLEQSKTLKMFPFSEKDEKKLRPHKIRLNSTKETIVSIPDEENAVAVVEQTHENQIKEQRESIKIQALLSDIGEKLGFKIWLPRADRNRVLEIWKPQEDTLVEELPLVFDEATLNTIRNIDVLWIRRRSIVRAFEVEDTTSIYSGILRMADLFSLQPMLDIKIHIVAPSSRRESVFEQITRPVFAVMEKGPLADLCTYISYDSIYALSKVQHLRHMFDSIIEDYIESANG